MNNTIQKIKTMPAGAKITAGVIAGLIFGIAVGGAGGQGDTEAAPKPAPTVTVTAEPKVVEDNTRVAELEAELAAANSDLADCRDTTTVVIEAVTIVLAAFERQIDATLDAAAYGPTNALVAEQDAIVAEINRATSVMNTAPGC